MSTIAPTSPAESESAGRAGVAMLDAPVSGRRRAELHAGVMAGGEARRA